jgi:hypothetical protein
MQFGALQAVAIAESQERSLKVLLERIVGGVSQSGNVALARVWLLGQDRVCGVCQRRPGHPRPVGTTSSDGKCGTTNQPAHRNEDWSRLDGEFHNGGIKIAEVNASEHPTLVKIAEDHHWIEKPDWAKSERIKSFAGHPLLFRGLRVGALGVFSLRLVRRFLFMVVSASPTRHASHELGAGCSFESNRRLRRQCRNGRSDDGSGDKAARTRQHRRRTGPEQRKNLWTRRCRRVTRTETHGDWCTPEEAATQIK